MYVHVPIKHIISSFPGRDAMADQPPLSQTSGSNIGTSSASKPKIPFKAFPHKGRSPRPPQPQNVPFKVRPPRPPQPQDLPNLPHQQRTTDPPHQTTLPPEPLCHCRHKTNNPILLCSSKNHRQIHRPSLCQHQWALMPSHHFHQICQCQSHSILRHPLLHN